MSDRHRSQRGSFYGDKRPEGYQPRRSRREEEAAKRTESGGKPVELGKEYKVRIIDRSERGEGVARIEGFIVFVRGGKPGEEVRIRITNVGARAATGEIVPETTATVTTTTPETTTTTTTAPETTSETPAQPAES